MRVKIFEIKCPRGEQSWAVKATCTIEAIEIFCGEMYQMDQELFDWAVCPIKKEEFATRKFIQEEDYLISAGQSTKELPLTLMTGFIVELV